MENNISKIKTTIEGWTALLVFLVVLLFSGNVDANTKQQYNVYDKKGMYQGKVVVKENGKTETYDRTGKQQHRIDKNGNVYDRQGRRVGKVKQK